MNTVGNPLLWSGFIVIVSIMLALDLFMQDCREDKPSSIKKAVVWSLLWIALALIFNAIFWTYLLYTDGCDVANTKALAFFTGYLLEKMLSADNVCVWFMLFNYFSIPIFLQRRLLTWGILCAIGLRGIIVFSGTWMISQFHWLLHVFGVFLIFTGIKVAVSMSHHKEKNIGQRPLVRWLYRHLRVTSELYGTRFFIRKEGILFSTVLLVAFITIEVSDIIFSLDSIPAIFSITSDPFIILTSNLFAILGLRAMYFLLAHFAERFLLIKYGLTVILVFIGIKMLIIDFFDISIVVFLAIVIITLIVTILINAWLNRRQEHIH